MGVLDALGHALGVAGSMTWQITWSLILGFSLLHAAPATVVCAAESALVAEGRGAEAGRFPDNPSLLLGREKLCDTAQETPVRPMGAVPWLTIQNRSPTISRPPH